MRSQLTTQWRRSTRPGRRNRRAFTLIELLVVIVIIAILIGLLGVAFSGALSTSKRASVESLMRTIQTGLAQFETDFGYLPPLIDGDKIALDSIDDPNDPAEFADEMRDHRYHSVYTLPLYLLGVGELAPDYLTSVQPGVDPDRHDGKEGPGFRDPGPDHSWGGARDRAKHRPKRTGRVYGPYIDIGSGEDVLRKAEMRDFVLPPDNTNPFEFFADGGPNGENGDGVGDLFVIQDRWGDAIRYYKNWPKRELDPATMKTRPSLNLAPIELRTFESLTQHLTNPLSTIGADPLLDPDLLRAPYALLSAGADMDFGDTDAGGVWIDDEVFFASSGTIDPAKISVIDRIKDNIRTTP